MTNALSSLKSLPCPAGDKCIAFECLFNHENDKPVTPSPSLLPINSGATHDGPNDSKRIKTGANNVAQAKEHASLPLFAPPPLKSNPPSAQPGSKPKPKPVPSTPGPPVRHKRPISPSSPPTAVASSAVPSQPKPGMTGGRTPKPVPREPEALNPRLLKKSPAQHDLRLKLVKALHEQYNRLNSELKKDSSAVKSKLILSPQELITRTLDDEQDIALKRPSIYSNVVKQKIMTYKRMKADEWRKEREKAVKDASGATAATDACEPIVTGLSLPQEIDFLHRLVWPFDSLAKHGYISRIPTEEEITAAQEAIAACGNNEVCDRCTARFQVFPGRREEDGALTSKGACTYHPGKPYYVERAPGDRSKPQRKYRCCHQRLDDEEAASCAVASSHVFKTTDPKRLASVLNFAETPFNPDVPPERAICFDCEMGYTVYGLELIRLTVVNWPNGEELIDILVQPSGETLDLNTQFSGVRPEDMVKAERWKPGDDPSPTLVPSTSGDRPERRLKLASSPRAARDLLFSMISPSTPVIGHGLENDLNAMRIIHPTCIDTALIYPHPRGLPIRHSLKNLMKTHLGRDIQMNGTETAGGDASDPQNNTAAGHDSAEDARAAGELVRLKVRDEWKSLQLQGWTVNENEAEVIPPGGR